MSTFKIYPQILPNNLVGLSGIDSNNASPTELVVDSSSIANGVYSTLEDAIAAASSGDTIKLVAGTYRGSLTEQSGVATTVTPVTISKSVKIVGDNLGHGITDSINVTLEGYVFTLSSAVEFKNLVILTIGSESVFTGATASKSLFDNLYCKGAVGVFFDLSTNVNGSWSVNNSTFLFTTSGVYCSLGGANSISFYGCVLSSGQFVHAGTSALTMYDCKGAARTLCSGSGNIRYSSCSLSGGSIIEALAGATGTFLAEIYNCNLLNTSYAALNTVAGYTLDIDIANSHIRGINAVYAHTGNIIGKIRHCNIQNTGDCIHGLNGDIGGSTADRFLVHHCSIDTPESAINVKAGDMWIDFSHCHVVNSKYLINSGGAAGYNGNIDINYDHSSCKASIYGIIHGVGLTTGNIDMDANNSSLVSDSHLMISYGTGGANLSLRLIKCNFGVSTVAAATAQVFNKSGTDIIYVKTGDSTITPGSTGTVGGSITDAFPFFVTHTTAGPKPASFGGMLFDTSVGALNLGISIPPGKAGQTLLLKYEAKGGVAVIIVDLPTVFLGYSSLQLNDADDYATLISDGTSWIVTYVSAGVLLA